MPELFRPVGYLFVFFLALALLYSVGVFSRSIWFDEAITLQSLAAVSYRGIAGGALQIAELKTYLSGTTTLPQLFDHYVTTDVHPPGFFLIAHVVTLVFGNTLIVVRAVSLILVLASVVLYMRALQRIGEADYWVFVLVYGFSFAAMSTAQDARGYALVLFLSIAAWRVLTELPETAGRARIIREVLLGAVCGSLMLSHYFAALLVSALLAWHLCEAIVRRTPLALIAPVVCVFVFLPWFPVMLDHLSARPEQMTGFRGPIEWVRRVANLIPGQVFSASHYAVPNELQKLGRIMVLGVMVLGALAVLWRPGSSPQQARFARIAVFVPSLGLLGFLAMSLLLDRWFDTLRYYLFFAPFVAYLAARGMLALGSGLVRLGDARLRLVPVGLLIAAQAAMLNFGWETNRNRGGAYYNTIATAVREIGIEDSLVIIDMGSGSGTPLAAAYTLPEETNAYLLERNSADWPLAVAEIASLVANLQQVLLIFTIERGSMESDKTQLYGTIVEALDDAGFSRVPAPPADQGRRHYARWIKADGTD